MNDTPLEMEVATWVGLARLNFGQTWDPMMMPPLQVAQTSQTVLMPLQVSQTSQTVLMPLQVSQTSQTVLMPLEVAQTSHIQVATWFGLARLTFDQTWDPMMMPPLQVAQTLQTVLMPLEVAQTSQTVLMPFWVEVEAAQTVLMPLEVAQTSQTVLMPFWVDDASGDDESWAFVWTGPVDGVDCPTFGGGPGGGPGGPRNAAPDSLATPRLELIKHPMVKNQKSNAHNIYIYYIYIYKFLKIYIKYINIYK